MSRACLWSGRLVGLLVGCALLTAVHAGATVGFATASDVATRSVAFVALSDEAVLGVNVEVFSDPDGTAPVTGATVDVVSASVNGAHDKGVVKAVVNDLAPQTTYYLRVTLNGVGGDVVFPGAPPLFAVTSAAPLQSLAPIGPLQLNELVRREIYMPAAIVDIEPVLFLADVAGAAAPLSVFAESAAAVPSGLLDLNNLRDQAGARLLLSEGAPLRFDALYGLPCGERDYQVSFGRTPPFTQAGQPLAFIPPAACFFADAVCDGVVDVLDFQFLLDSLDQTTGDCGYSPQLDIVLDGVIDSLDQQSLIDRFGESEPFN